MAIFDNKHPIKICKMANIGLGRDTGMQCFGSYFGENGKIKCV